MQTPYCAPTERGLTPTWLQQKKKSGMQRPKLTPIKICWDRDISVLPTLFGKWSLGSAGQHKKWWQNKEKDSIRGQGSKKVTRKSAFEEQEPFLCFIQWTCERYKVCNESVTHSLSAPVPSRWRPATSACPLHFWPCRQTTCFLLCCGSSSH